MALRAESFDLRLAAFATVSASPSVELLDTPHESAEPGIAADEVWIPDRQNLRPLVHAFETLFRFRGCFNRRNPEMLRPRRMQRDLQALPTIFQSQRRPRHRSAEAKILFAVGSFEKSVSCVRSQQIGHRLEADRHRTLQRRFELKSQLTRDFATTRRGTKRKLLGDRDLRR